MAIKKLSEIADLYCISKTVQPQIGDVALHRSGNKVLVVTEDNLPEVAFKSVSVFFGIHPKSVSSEAICAYLQSPEGQAEIEKHLTGTTMRTLCLVQANQIDVVVE